MICPQVLNQQSVLEAFYEIKDHLSLPFAVEIIILAAYGTYGLLETGRFLKIRLLL
jgi:hypothetical protein